MSQGKQINRRVFLRTTGTAALAGAFASSPSTAMPIGAGPAAAQAQGMQDVFMNILTTNGLVGRFVTDWAGPDAVLAGVSIKLGAPNLPGDTMNMLGSITALDAGTGQVEVAVTGSNSWGDHVTGTVKVVLPR